VVGFIARLPVKLSFTLGLSIQQTEGVIIVSLAEKLKEATRTGPGLPCGVSSLLESIKGEDKKALELIFSTKSVRGTIPNTKLHKILISEGHDIAFASIRHHRAQVCRCYTGKDGLMRKTNEVTKAS
jgi:hypothetical protein